MPLSHTAPRAPRRELGCWLVLAALFGVSRLVAWWAGLRFQVEPLGVFWQYLDPDLLRGDLLRSLLFLHAQPPLFNAFLGVVLKLGGGASGWLFAVLFLGFGAAYTAVTYVVMRRLGVRDWLAMLLTVLLVCRPATLLLESWLMYDLPVALLVMLAALALQRCFERPELGPRAISAAAALRRPSGVLHGFSWALLALCLTRSLFHPLFLWLACAALLFAPGLGLSRRRRFVALLLPLALVSAWQVKNLTLFGTASTSSWLGMNVLRIATAALPAGEAERLVEKGSLRVAHLQPFSALRRYPEDLRDETSAPSIEHPAVSMERKSTGASNYNHWAYLEISDASMQDALWLVRHRPAVYLRGLATAWYNYFQPQSTVEHLRSSRALLGAWADVWEGLMYVSVPTPWTYRGTLRHLPLAPMIAFPVLLVWGVLAMRRAAQRADHATAATLAFACAVVVWVAVVGNSLEVWENQRFRFYSDACSALLGAHLIETLLRRRRRSAP
ncbi:MAG: hypothetical protein DWQ36_16385 [Acidobacteria bacterium]|nr:MAG: hypothetical protein DWQ30_16455 [Acidobacteriota bacterium]REK05382.1 MAG: hypothetical protein DWQ36_16385 [Acidobacteriota bacterium]